MDIELLFKWRVTDMDIELLLKWKTNVCEMDINEFWLWIRRFWIFRAM